MPGGLRVALYPEAVVVLGRMMHQHQVAALIQPPWCEGGIAAQDWAPGGLSGTRSMV